MKIFYSKLLVLLSVFLVSCNSDDDSSTIENQDPIVGKRFVEAVEVDGEIIEANECEANSFYAFSFQRGFYHA